MPEKIKQFLFDFIKKTVFMSIFFFIGLLVSRNDVYQGFLDYYWLLIIGALLISIVNMYVKPKFQ